MPINASEAPATAAAGEQPCPPSHTGPGAEGGGGWPLQATAQPWHAEGRPLSTGALRCPQDLVALDSRKSAVALRAARNSDGP
jgi:hypothetical protein